MSSAIDLLICRPQPVVNTSAPPLLRTLHRLGIEPIDQTVVTSYKRLKIKQAHRQACRRWASAVLLLLTLFGTWSVVEHLLFPRSAINLPMVSAAVSATLLTAMSIEAVTHYFSNHLPGWAVWITVPVIFGTRRMLKEYGLPKEVAEQVRTITSRHPGACFVLHRLDEDPILDAHYRGESYTIAIWE